MSRDGLLLAFSMSVVDQEPSVVIFGAFAATTSAVIFQPTDPRAATPPYRPEVFS